jgi:hypothetical protein
MLKIEGQVIKPWEMMVSQGFIYSWNYGGIFYDFECRFASGCLER